MSIRVVLQAVDQVALLVDNMHKYVRAGRGVVIYVAFLQGEEEAQSGQNDIIEDAKIKKAVDTLIKTKIFTHFSPEKMLTRAQSLQESPEVDITIVPQASLAGKVKKGTIQFHSMIKDKQYCEGLYYRFVQEFREARGINGDTIDINGLPLDHEYRPPSDEDEWDGNGAHTTKVVIGDGEEKKDLLTGNLKDGWLKYNNRVICGTFGNRQAMQIESSGPFMHTFDL